MGGGCFSIDLFIGFFTSSVIFFSLNKLFPVAGLGEFDEIDTYGTFTHQEAARMGVVPADQILEANDGSDGVLRETIERGEK